MTPFWYIISTRVIRNQNIFFLYQLIKDRFQEILIINMSSLITLFIFTGLSQLIKI